MNTAPIAANLRTLLAELVHGAPYDGAYMLNRGDPGMLAALDRLSAHDASRTHGGGASIAAHVEHVRFGLALLNEWFAGIRRIEDPDWTAAWKKNEYSDGEWARLRRDFRAEVERWLATLAEPREAGALELNDMIGSIAHLAYHLGAIRQIDRQLRGPAATDPLVAKP